MRRSAFLKVPTKTKPLTREQRLALFRLYNRVNWNAKPASYLAFRRTAYQDNIMGCVVVPWANMWIGIEPNGYTHS